MPAVGEHSTAKYYVDKTISNSVHESSLLALDPNEELKLDAQGCMIPNSTFNMTKNDERNIDESLGRFFI